MSFVVVVADQLHPAGLEGLRQANGFEVLSVVDHPDRLLTEVRQAHALLVRSATQVTEAVLGAAPHLRVVGRAGMGVDNIDVDAATRRGIAVLNAPGANTISTAEHTMALLLAMVRHIAPAAASMATGGWDRARFGGTELRGKTLGLVGLGRIGAHVATIARALGMQVAAYDPYLSDARARDLQVELLPLDQLLRQADVVSLHAPLTERTHHLLDADRLALMKPGALVVNAARGDLIDTTALIEAVESGHLGGAALDVYDEEPLAADSPLRSTERILLTPHLAASTGEAQERVSVEICAAVRRALECGDVGGAVNVPGVTNEQLGRARSVMDLSRRVGRMAGSLAPGPVSGVEVSFAGPEDDLAKPVQLGAVEGVLQAMGVGPVSLVNVTVLAEERGIAVSRRVGRAPGGNVITVGVSVRSRDRSVGVRGLVTNGVEGQGRIMEIDGYAVDIPADGAILILRNRDVPGVIGRVGTALGAAGVNIAFYHQSRAANGRSLALAAIAVDHAPTAAVLESLEQLPDVIEVRLADVTDPPS